jgi:hypothetical protein
MTETKEVIWLEVKTVVKIPIRSADPFIVASDVENGELATIIKEPYIQSAEKSRFGKERTVVTVQLQRTKQTYRMTLNTTSNDKLVHAFGEEGSLWQNKQFKIKVVDMNISGVNRSVLYAIPVDQKLLAPDEPR